MIINKRCAQTWHIQKGKLWLQIEGEVLKPIICYRSLTLPCRFWNKVKLKRRWAYIVFNPLIMSCRRELIVTEVNISFKIVSVRIPSFFIMLPVRYMVVAWVSEILLPCHIPLHASPVPDKSFAFACLPQADKYTPFYRPPLQTCSSVECVGRSSELLDQSHSSVQRIWKTLNCKSNLSLQQKLWFMKVGQTFHQASVDIQCITERVFSFFVLNQFLFFLSLTLWHRVPRTRAWDSIEWLLQISAVHIKAIWSVQFLWIFKDGVACMACSSLSRHVQVFKNPSIHTKKIKLWHLWARSPKILHLPNGMFDPDIIGINGMQGKNWGQVPVQYKIKFFASPQPLRKCCDMSLVWYMWICVFYLRAP